MSRAHRGLGWGLWVVLALAGGCGGAAPPPETIQRAPERCVTAEALPGCEQRLAGYQRRLDDVLRALGRRYGPVMRPDGQSLAAPEMEPPPEAEREPAPELELSPAGPPAPGPSAPSAPPSAPDCSSARDLRDRICELADAICALAARPGAAERTAAQCDSARKSCERARRDVSRTCPRASR